MQQPVTLEVGGQQLVGMVHYPAKTPAPGVALFHGFTGHKAEAHRLFVQAARALAEAGLCVLRVDFRGSGDSEGNFEEMTISREVEDAEAILRFLFNLEGVLPHKLGILGLSLGGAVAALLAGNHPELKAVALWSAVADPLELWQTRLAPPPPPGPKGCYDLGGLLLGQQFLDDLPNHRPAEALGRYPGPVLVVHSKQDQVVPYEHSQRFLAAHQGVHEHLVLEEADHVFGTYEDTRRVISETTRFLAGELLK